MQRKISINNVIAIKNLLIILKKNNRFCSTWRASSTKHTPSWCDWPRTYRLSNETPRGQVMGLRILSDTVLERWEDVVIDMIDYWINSYKNQCECKQAIYAWQWISVGLCVHHTCMSSDNAEPLSAVWS